MKLYQRKRGNCGMDCVDIRSGDSVAVRPGYGVVISGTCGYVINCTMTLSADGNAKTIEGDSEGNTAQ